MKKFICWLFNIKPEIRYIEKELPKGSILIEADYIKLDDVEIGVE